jgi:hypothetical protein
MRFVMITALLLSTGPVAAREAHCMARILSDVAAEEAPEQIKSKSNGQFGPVTTMKVNKNSGKMLFCAENSYCYNSNAFELITPCRVKRDTPASDQSYFLFFTR